MAACGALSVAAAVFGDGLERTLAALAVGPDLTPTADKIRGDGRTMLSLDRPDERKLSSPDGTSTALQRLLAGQLSASPNFDGDKTLA